MSRRLADEPDLDEAFRGTVASFDGSVAIAAGSTRAPGQVLLALRGSGQALYVGLAEDAYVVASEPYGVVEETSTYLRMDGETSPGASAPGQIVVLDRAGAGTIEGIRRFAYDGTPLPVREDELSTATITTRDIDRGEFPHFLLKELSEAPQSFRKTLRGRIEEHNGTLAVALGPEALPDAIVERLRNRTIRRVLVIGQGTAAVAGQAIAAAIDGEVGATRLLVGALPATELSGFALDDDMADTLVVAVSQSGTTTDTNRTVDLVRARGASVIGIVNRRNSDLVEKAHGVLYTSDGRDVEMSVASTKAFYAQIAAGYLLALAIAASAGPREPGRAPRAARGAARPPDGDGAGAGPAGRDRGRGPAPCAGPALLGGRGQRAQPRRRPGDPDQALGALLQVDRVRHHRGQEAHRPLVGAADPRVRGRARGSQRRRRGQGGGHLPRPQGGARW